MGKFFAVFAALGLAVAVLVSPAPAEAKPNSKPPRPTPTATPTPTPTPKPTPKPSPTPTPSPSPTPAPTPTPNPTPSPTPNPSPTPAFLDGIDVSYHQGTIDWARVAGAGKAFAFVRATAGTLTSDVAYARNRADARAAGVAVGSYHFGNPDSAANDALNEARWFVQNATVAFGRPRAGPRPRGVERPGCGGAHDVGQDVADRGRVDDRGPPAHLHHSELLVELDGQHRLVRSERVSRLGSALDDGGAAHRPGRQLGRPRLDVLAAFIHRERSRRQRTGGPGPI